MKLSLSPSSRLRIQSHSTLGSTGTSLSLSENFSSRQHIALLELYIPDMMRIFHFLEKAKKTITECERHITTRMHSLQGVRATAKFSKENSQSVEKGDKEKERKSRRKIKENDEMRVLTCYQTRHLPLSYLFALSY